MKNNIIIYIIVALLLSSLFGFNLLINLIGNFLILLFLVPLLFLGIAILFFNSLKAKIKSCENCGSTMLGDNEICIYCGEKLESKEVSQNEYKQKASEATIEIDAEEIK